MKKKNAGQSRGLSIWLSYQNYVEHAMQPSAGGRESELEYISNRLFTKAILYCLPIAFLVLIPNVYINLKAGENTFMPYLGMSLLFLIGVFSLNPRISLAYRKLIASGALLSMGVVLIELKGNFGIGSICLLTCSIFYALHFSDKFARRGVLINALICAGFILIAALKFLPKEIQRGITVEHWITYSINFLFLNILVVIMIRQTIARLERTLKMEASLHRELKQELDGKQLLNDSLKESEYLYRALFSMSPSANLIFDKETLQFLAVNKASTRIYHFSNEEFLSMNLADIYPSATVSDLLLQLKYARDFDGSPVPVNTKHLRKDGSLINVEFLAADIDFEGRPAKMIVVSDITKQISQVKAIKKQNEKLKEIAFVQSHVIRMPLTKIMALTDLIEKDLKENIDQELLTSLTQSSNELDSMIRKIVSDSENILIEFNSLSD